jgi:hypothetical protein
VNGACRNGLHPAPPVFDQPDVSSGSLTNLTRSGLNVAIESGFLPRSDQMRPDRGVNVWNYNVFRA